jgi:hypothetical protein
MILGMTPMALGVGEGREQNAPVARAVIGGLLFATARPFADEIQTDGAGRMSVCPQSGVIRA